jgi:hypothetical protein
MTQKLWESWSEKGDVVLELFRLPFMEAGKAGQNNFDGLHGSGAFKERVESL